MDLSQTTPKLAEKIIGYGLITLLALIAAAIFFYHYNYDKQHPDVELTNAELHTDKGNAETELLSLLPSGFKAKTPPEVFNSNSLYEKINGKAGMYTQTGFRQLKCLRFAGAQDESLWGEIFIYDMGDLRNAFTVYSTQRRPDATPLPITRFAYSAGNSIFFVTAGNYVEILTGFDSKKLHEAMLAAAKNIIKISPDTNDSISELGLFPRQNLVPHSFKLYLHDAFGFNGIDNTYTAEYLLNGQRFTAFISMQQNPQRAQEISQKFRSFFTENGAVPVTASNKNLSEAVLNFYDSIEVIFAVGNYVAGVHQAEDKVMAEKIALMLKNKLTGISSGNRK